MARRGVGRSPRRVVAGGAVLLLVVAALVVRLNPAAARPVVRAAHAAGVGFSITTRPRLNPAFNPAVRAYVTRCEPAEKVRVTVSDASRTPVSVDKQPIETSRFSTTLKIGGGQTFTISAGSRPGQATYTVRCLPANFPRYSVQTTTGQPQAAYYLVTPSAARVKAPAAPYVVLFDRHGVPVWWYNDASGSPIDAEMLPGGGLSWYVYKNRFNRQNLPALTSEMLGFGPPAGVSQGFNVPSGVDLVEYSVNGTLRSRLDTVGSPTDFHEGLPLANGDFLMTSYALRRNANLSPLFTAPVNALDATFQVINPHGSLVSSWTSVGRIGPAETAPGGRGFLLNYPGAIGPAWDYQHIDSVAPDGNGYLISLAHTGAIYLVNASDGSIEWKLGGSPTPQSLTIVGDFFARSDFANPSDARVWPDGTVSVYDNGTASAPGPRVLRFRIDPQARTATLVQTLTEPLAVSSQCCGSARLLPGGDWVVSWGTTGIVDELAPDGQPVLRLTFAAPYYTYRAVPILPGQVRAGALAAAMNTITPRIPSGARPPTLTRLRVTGGHSRIRIRFTLAFRARVRLTLERCVSATTQGRCIRFARYGAKVISAGRRGVNHVTLTGQTVRASFAPGQYRLTATPLAGNRTGTPATARFAFTS